MSGSPPLVRLDSTWMSAVLPPRVPSVPKLRKSNRRGRPKPRDTSQGVGKGSISRVLFLDHFLMIYSHHFILCFFCSPIYTPKSNTQVILSYIYTCFTPTSFSSFLYSFFSIKNKNAARAWARDQILSDFFLAKILNYFLSLIYFLCFRSPLYTKDIFQKSNIKVIFSYIHV